MRACAFLCVVVSSLIPYINSLENKKRDVCVSLLTQLPDNEQLKKRDHNRRKLSVFIHAFFLVIIWCLDYPECNSTTNSLVGEFGCVCRRKCILNRLLKTNK